MLNGDVWNVQRLHVFCWSVDDSNSVFTLSVGRTRLASSSQPQFLIPHTTPSSTDSSPDILLATLSLPLHLRYMVDFTAVGCSITVNYSSSRCKMTDIMLFVKLCVSTCYVPRREVVAGRNEVEFLRGFHSVPAQMTASRGRDWGGPVFNSPMLKLALSTWIVPKDSLEDRLKKLISSSPVMLFMKGTPDAPKCGFSSKVVNALTEDGVSFGSFDILTDEEVRQGLKVFSNWPTFPQLYYKGELIGGCDIILELKNNGELKATLTE
ncbi:hypothetical protein ACLB2K_032759 [Fragaria x ananassa]